MYSTNGNEHDEYVGILRGKHYAYFIFLHLHATYWYSVLILNTNLLLLVKTISKYMDSVNM